MNDGPCLHFATALLAHGWADNVRIRVAGGLITAIEQSIAPGAQDERHAVALPGLANLHSHAFQRGMAALAEARSVDEDSFWTWRQVMYRFVDRLTPDDVAVIAAQAYAEMLEAGFTRVGEFHYLHHDRDGSAFADPAAMTAAIVAAAADTGIALTHLPVFYAHAGFGGTMPGDGQRRFIHDLDGFASLLEAARVKVSVLPDAIVGIAPHSLRAVTPEELAALLPLAGEAPIHIHIAEQLREVQECLAWSGARPVAWLLDHAPVDARWCLVHATHMTGDETAALAHSGAVAGLCPITEANLGDGLFPAEAFLAARGRYGIGSDCNIRIDATEELRLLEYGQRLRRLGRNLLADRSAASPGGSTGGALYRGALAGGAQALGAKAGLAVGVAADIVSLDAGHCSLIARNGDALLDALIFSAGTGVIDRVWRRGREVVMNGRHIARDAIALRYRATLTKLLA